MVDLTIFKKIDNNNYELINLENGNRYKLLLEFYGIEAEPRDILSLHEKLLDKNYEGYCQPYAFEKTTTHSAVEISKNLDLAILKKIDENITLKRLYG